MAINVKINEGVKGSIPTVGAIITANIAGYIPAHPFWPIVRPNEPAKFAIPSGTPNCLVCVLTFKGNAPALVREVKAKANTGNTFLTYVIGFTPMIVRITKWTINIAANAT